MLAIWDIVFLLPRLDNTSRNSDGGIVCEVLETISIIELRSSPKPVVCTVMGLSSPNADQGSTSTPSVASSWKDTLPIPRVVHGPVGFEPETCVLVLMDFCKVFVASCRNGNPSFAKSSSLIIQPLAPHKASCYPATQRRRIVNETDCHYFKRVFQFWQSNRYFSINVNKKLAKVPYLCTRSLIAIFTDWCGSILLRLMLNLLYVPLNLIEGETCVNAVKNISIEVSQCQRFWLRARYEPSSSSL